MKISQIKRIIFEYYEPLIRLDDIHTEELLERFSSSELLPHNLNHKNVRTDEEHESDVERYFKEIEISGMLTFCYYPRQATYQFEASHQTSLVLPGETRIWDYLNALTSVDCWLEGMVRGWRGGENNRNDQLQIVSEKRFPVIIRTDFIKFSSTLPIFKLILLDLDFYMSRDEIYFFRWLQIIFSFNYVVLQSYFY